MREAERDSGTDGKRGSGESVGVRGPGRSRGRWSAEEKARVVHESLRPGKRVGEVARRYGLSRWQLSSWRSLARQGKLAVPSSAEPVVVEPEPQPAFATLEVASARGPASIASVSIKARGVTVRLDGDIGGWRIAEVASALRGLR